MQKFWRKGLGLDQFDGIERSGKAFGSHEKHQAIGERLALFARGAMGIGDAEHGAGDHRLIATPQEERFVEPPLDAVLRARNGPA